MSNTKLAVILIRGIIGTSPDVKKTLELLRLKKKHSCVVLDDNAISRGMVQRVKDYVTYGTIDEETFMKIVEKRAEISSSAKAAELKVDLNKVAKEYFSGKLAMKDLDAKGLKPFFRLHPPVKGYERKGIKMPFAKGGVLGDRKDSMKDLILRMI